MKSTYGWVAAVVLAATPALAQSGGAATTTRETTIQTPDGKTITFTGTVTEYVPHKTIVIRDSNQKLVTYTLNPDVVIPADVQVGKTVTIYGSPSGDGTTVTKVVTTSLTDEGNIKTTTQKTRTMPDGSTVTTTGTVVEFVPKKTIVIRDASNQLVTYQLRPDVVLPGDVSVGKTVTVYASPSASGAASVSKVTTSSVTPEGDLKTTTRTTETSAEGTTTTTEETSVEGVVSGYNQATKTVTVERPDHTTVTYVIDSTAAVPADLSIGKRVMLRIFPHGQKRVVRTITYTTTQ